MWKSRIEHLDQKSQKISIFDNATPVEFREALKGWQQDASFRTFFISLLDKAPFTAFRWETPPVTTATADRPFEFALLDCPSLARTPDLVSFESHFGPAGARSAAAFKNLGKDATLIIPMPLAPPAIYVHLASFVREAPEPQKHEFWQLVGATMAEQIGQRPLWLSTAGMGVAWLHVRIDSRPKYYGHAPYARVQ